MKNIELVAWDVVFVSLLVLTVVESAFVIARRTASPRYEGSVMGDLVTRITLGFMVICLGVIVRVAGWMPLSFLLAIGQQDAAYAWISHSWTWTSASVVTCVAGLSILFWDYILRHRFGASIVAGGAVVGGIALAIFG